MNFSLPTLIAAARALDESCWHLARAIDDPAYEKPHAPELLIQAERALDEVESRYNALRATESNVPEFKEWLGYSE